MGEYASARVGGKGKLHSCDYTGCVRRSLWLSLGGRRPPKSISAAVPFWLLGTWHLVARCRLKGRHSGQHDVPDFN